MAGDKKYRLPLKKKLIQQLLQIFPLLFSFVLGLSLSPLWWESKTMRGDFFRHFLPWVISPTAFAFQNFSTIALTVNPITDKVSGHGHEFDILYDRYFTAAEAAADVKLLEIGLGCNMEYGPGASASIWPQLFPNGEIWFAESDQACVDAYWNESLPWKVVVGDQGDRDTVESWVATTGGGFDFIIDDGGHSNPQIWTSFAVLFRTALNPGGVYFIEDIHMGRVDPWFSGGIPNSGSGKVMIDVLTDWVAQLVEAAIPHSEFWGQWRHPPQQEPTFRLPRDIERIDCIRELCAVTKSRG